MKQLFTNLVEDSFVFFLSVASTYLTFLSLYKGDFSWLFIQAYGPILCFLILYFLATLNFLGRYNFRGRRRTLLKGLGGAVLYAGSLYGLAFLFPNYQYSRQIVLILGGYLVFFLLVMELCYGLYRKLR